MTSIDSAALEAAKRICSMGLGTRTNWRDADSVSRALLAASDRLSELELVEESAIRNFDRAEKAEAEVSKAETFLGEGFNRRHWLGKSAVDALIMGYCDAQSEAIGIELKLAETTKVAAQHENALLALRAAVREADGGIGWLAQLNVGLEGVAEAYDKALDLLRERTRQHMGSESESPKG